MPILESLTLSLRLRCENDAVQSGSEVRKRRSLWGRAYGRDGVAIYKNRGAGTRRLEKDLRLLDTGRNLERDSLVILLSTHSDVKDAVRRGDGAARPRKSQQARRDGDGAVSVGGLRTPRTCSLSHAVGPLDHP